MPHEQGKHMAPWQPKFPLHRAGTSSHLTRSPLFDQLSVDLVAADASSLSRNASKGASPPKHQPLRTTKVSPNKSKTFPSGFMLPAAMVLSGGSTSPPVSPSKTPFLTDATFHSPISFGAAVDSPNNDSGASASPTFLTATTLTNVSNGGTLNDLITSQSSSPATRRTVVVAPKTMECTIPLLKKPSLPPDLRTKQLMFGGGFMVDANIITSASSPPKKHPHHRVVMVDAKGDPLH
ncbi:Aste57867_1818 [Aphanomyces stellatus]|uniref:Aste57867_1818 protein n=1 Tax=Aphanomyces stellatus TaxID=120398 RepID=A0A485K750_9STRA|nr:hypothetical protein As57867_001816 [Aphanomyces stellatus]VFT79027.1 Aste57867_1818 [Aphanomyces stellatus]